MINKRIKKKGEINAEKIKNDGIYELTLDEMKEVVGGASIPAPSHDQDRICTLAPFDCYMCHCKLIYAGQDVEVMTGELVGSWRCPKCNRYFVRDNRPKL